MTIRAFETSCIRAANAFLMYLGALFSPFFIVASFDPARIGNLVIGCLLLANLLYSLCKLFPQRYSLVKSDKLAFVTIPLFLAPIGVLFSIVGLYA
jgi:hypothetical protein